MSNSEPYTTTDAPKANQSFEAGETAPEAGHDLQQSPTSTSVKTSGSRRRKLTGAIRNRFRHSRTASKDSVVSVDDGNYQEPRRESASSTEIKLPSHENSAAVVSGNEAGVRGQHNVADAGHVSSGPVPTYDQPHPMNGQARFIVTLFAGTGAAALVASHLHWLLGWIVLFIGGHALWKGLLKSISDAEFTAHQQYVQEQWKQSGHTETVQWMNSIVSSVWPLINNEVFVPFVDLLEDALAQQVPGIVHAVRVEDLDQGVVPLTVNSLKVLPPGEEHFLGNPKADQQQKGQQEHHRTEADRAAAAASVEEEQQHIDVGEHVNIEISFSYRAPAHAQKGATTKSSNADNSSSVGEADESQDIGGAAQQPQQTASWSSYFASKAHSRNNAGGPAETIHMLLYLAIGLQKIAAVEVPVWVEMIGIEGRMRLRIQLIPSTPFVKHVGFTLLGQPKLELKAKPLGRRMAIDAMNLPLLSSYVLRSIQTTVAPFVAPGSYTVDLGGLLGAGDGPTNTYALGVICVVIHSASDLPAADTNGHADPFVSISFARAGKPLFRTRVLVKTKNPVWQEVAYILVSPDEVRDHDRLRLTAFDADRFSADDPLGKVEISVDRLISKSLIRDTDPDSCASMELRDDPLVPMARGSRTQGRLKYSITFARLVLNADSKNVASTPRRAQLMQQAASRAQKEQQRGEVDQPWEDNSPAVPGVQSTTEAESGTSDDWKSVETPFDSFIRRLGLPMDDDVMKARHERRERVRKLTSMLSGEKSAMESPPDHNWPAGILAFHIHSIQGLEVTRTQRSFKAANLSGGAAKSQITTEDPTSEGSGSLPSSYVQVFLNDQPTLRTRTKKYDPRPFINAGSERVIYDWRTARVDFVVRDSRQREGDAILGVVGLKVADVLASGSRKSGWYTLTGGLGFGKMQVTLLWRSAHLPIPRALSGWNVGVIEFSRLSAEVTSNHFDGKDAHFVFYTNGGTATTKSLTGQTQGESTYSYTHDIAENPLRIPIRQRYPGELIITFKVSARSAGKHRPRAIAVVPLHMLHDNAPTDFKVPLYLSSDWMHVEQAALKALVNDSDGRIERTEDHRHVHTKALEQVCSPNLDALPEVLAPKDGDYHTASLQRVGFVHLALHFFPGLADEHRSILAGDHELRFAYESWQTLVDCGERERPMNVRRWKRQSGRMFTEKTPEPSQVAQGKMREKDFSTQASAGGDLSQNLAPPLSGASVTDAAMLYSQKHERDSRDIGGAERDQQEYDSDDGYEPSIIASSAGDALQARAVEQADVHPERDGDADSTSSSSLDEGEDGDDSASIAEDRRARRRNLHRQERGAAQIKSVRTLSWLKQNLQDGMDRVGRNVGSVNERYGSSQRRRMLGKMEKEGVSKF